MGFILLGGFVVLIVWFVRKFFKFPAFGAVTMITGGVKCGKSALTVKFARRAYRKALVGYYISCVVAKLFRRELPEKPLLYSNIPLYKVKYVPLTLDHLLRKKRFNYKSIVLLDEVSLVADSMLSVNQKSTDVNTQLLLFCKLFGHETKGGKLFANTHVLSDVHFAFKRTTSTYYYVHSLSRFPFFSFFHVREERYSDDGTVVNSYSEDAQRSMLRIIAYNGLYKRYDAYCYSKLTDSCPTANIVKFNRSRADLKLNKIVSFRPEFQKLGTARKSDKNFLAAGLALQHSTSEVNNNAQT